MNLYLISLFFSGKNISWVFIFMKQLIKKKGVFFYVAHDGVPVQT